MSHIFISVHTFPQKNVIIIKSFGNHYTLSDFFVLLFMKVPFKFTRKEENYEASK